MKFSVSLYSFFSAIRNGELNPMDCIAKAKEMGFDAIEAVDFVMGCPPEEMPEQAKKIKAEADKHGLAVSSFAISADLLNGQDGSGDVAKEIARVKSMVDIAEILGAPTCATISPWARRALPAAMPLWSLSWPSLSVKSRSTPPTRALSP